MKSKMSEWLRRYIPAEAVSVVATMLAAGLFYALGGSRVAIALAGTWGGNVGYYGYILFVDVRRSIQEHRLASKRYNGGSFLRDIRALGIEFGIGELMDSLFIRPTLMFYLPLWLGSMGWGILIAKFAADICFYIPTVMGYEAAKKYLRRVGG